MLGNVHDALGVIAAHAQASAMSSTKPWTRAGGVCLGGTLIDADRCAVINPDSGHDLWFSGKHKRHGGNVQALCEPSGRHVLLLPGRACGP